MCNSIEAHAQSGALSVQLPSDRQRRFLANRVGAQVQKVQHRAVTVNGGYQRG